MTLNKNSDNVAELIIYLHELVYEYTDKISDEMIEFDKNLSAQQKKK